MLTITVNNPNFLPGVQLGVTGLGQFENGVPREVTAEQESLYHVTTRKLVQDLKGVFTVEGTPEYSAPVDAPEPETPMVSVEPETPVIRGTTEPQEGSVT
jgi:hypothetical protein